MKLFIGCSSSNDTPSMYIEDCKKFLEELFMLDYDLVFGACKEGIMGLSYDVALNNFRDIIGIFPEVYKNGAENLQCLKIPVRTINDRTDKLISESDALVFLPGGFGTIYELFTAIESKRGSEHDKPIIIYNSCGYFDKLLNFISLMYEERFASNKIKDYYYVCDNIDDVVLYINNYYKKNKVRRIN